MSVSDADAAAQAAEETTARDAIVAAVERLLQEHTLDEIRVAQILTEANVSRATFYFYFAGKDDAFVALLDDVIDQIVPQLETVVRERGDDGPGRLRKGISDFLRLSGSRGLVIRSASEEWPRSVDVRAHYLEGVRRQAEVLTRLIEEDRAAGRAIDGPPAALLASALLWTMERVWYRAVTGAPDFDDVDAAADAVADVVVSAIYGARA
jgi:AcrR family transcriptional regulator